MKKQIRILGVLLGLSVVMPSLGHAQDEANQSEMVLSPEQTAIVNRVRFDMVYNLKRGDSAFVKFQMASKVSSFHSLSRTTALVRGESVAKSGRSNSNYQSVRILRTWLDDAANREEMVRAVNAKYGLEILKEISQKEAQGEVVDMFVRQTILDKYLARAYEIKGIRPLRAYEVQVSTPNSSYESVYNVFDLVRSHGVDSEFFGIGDRVQVASRVASIEVYRNADVVGIFPNGDLLVKRGLEVTRKSIVDVFSAHNVYENSLYQVNEKVSYRYETSGKNLSEATTAAIESNGSVRRMKTVLPTSSVRETEAKVIAVSPVGDILVLIPKTGNVQRIKTKGNGPIRKILVTCEALFAK